MNLRNLKGILAIFAGYGAAFGCGWTAWKRTRRLAAARHWPSTKGRVLESFEYVDPDNKRTHFRVRFEFKVGDRIESATPRLSGDWFISGKAQTAFVARYLSGQEVEVFYHPRDPQLNCLDRTDRSGVNALWIVALAGALLATFLSLLLVAEE